MSNKEKIVGIYKITSPIGKVYIGQSTNISQRFSYYKSLRCKGQKHVYNSLNCYGAENHKFEIIKVCPIEYLNTLEVEYIKMYDSTNREIGLNLQSGGLNCIDSPETRLLKRTNSPIRVEFYAERNGVITKFNSMTEAEKTLGVTRKSIRESLKDCNKKVGKYSYSYEYPEQSSCNKRINGPRSEETKLLIKTNSKNKKQVTATIGNQTFDFNSIMEASEALGDSKKVIWFALNNPKRSKSRYKYCFK